MSSHSLKGELKDEQIMYPSYDKIIVPEYPIDPLELLGEKNFRKRAYFQDASGTPVQEFYRDATIFITGGTGFLGKSILEKLLRSCPHIKRIYLLIRPKKNKSSEERIIKMLQLRFFKRLRYEVPNFHRKISIMNGDLEQPYLGLSQNDKARLSEEVNIIFHNGASVRFVEKLNLAIKQNVLATREVIKLAKTAKFLKALVYVSTAYSFPIQSRVEERIYGMSMHYQEIIDRVVMMKEEDIEKETSKILGKWPNTYTFSKAVAECLIKNESQGLPISIFRPSVVVSTYREPIRGWADSLNGPFGLLTSIGSGITHAYLLDRHSNAVDMVPVDLVVNCLICIPKQTNENFINSTKNMEDDIPIYLYCSGPHHPITWQNVFDGIAKYGSQWPTNKAVWYYFFITTNNKYLYNVLVFFLHTIPAYLLDYFSKMIGKKPILKKVHVMMDVVTKDALEYFVQNQWTFVNSNTQNLWKNLSEEDQSLFLFNIGDMSWDYFFETAWLGARVYLINDDIPTLPAARRKWKRLYYASLFFFGLILGLVMYTLWTVVSFLYTVPKYIF